MRGTGGGATNRSEGVEILEALFSVDRILAPGFPTSHGPFAIYFRFSGLNGDHQLRVVFSVPRSRMAASQSRNTLTLWRGPLAGMPCRVRRGPFTTTSAAAAC